MYVSKNFSKIWRQKILPLLQKTVYLFLQISQMLQIKHLRYLTVGVVCKQFLKDWCS